MCAFDVAGRRKKEWTPWTDEEQSVVKSTFAKFFFSKGLPGKVEIDECIRRNPCLSNRKWSVIKDWIRNKKAKSQSSLMQQ
jgi:hypothetical protein